MFGKVESYTDPYTGCVELQPVTLSGPAEGVICKVGYDCNLDYPMVLTNGGTGGGYVGLSVCCPIYYNPYCCVGSDFHGNPIYKGVLTVDCIKAEDIEGAGLATSAKQCSYYDNMSYNLALWDNYDPEQDGYYNLGKSTAYPLTYNPFYGRLTDCGGYVTCDTCYCADSVCTCVTSFNVGNAYSSATFADDALVLRHLIGNNVCHKVLCSTSCATYLSGYTGGKIELNFDCGCESSLCVSCSNFVMNTCHIGLYTNGGSNHCCYKAICLDNQNGWLYLCNYSWGSGNSYLGASLGYIHMQGVNSTACCWYSQIGLGGICYFGHTDCPSQSWSICSNKEGISLKKCTCTSRLWCSEDGKFYCQNASGTYVQYDPGMSTPVSYEVCNCTLYITF